MYTRPKWNKLAEVLFSFTWEGRWWGLYLWSKKRNFHSKLCLEVNSSLGSSTVHISCRNRDYKRLFELMSMSCRQKMRTETKWPTSHTECFVCWSFISVFKNKAISCTNMYSVYQHTHTHIHPLSWWTYTQQISWRLSLSVRQMLEVTGPMRRCQVGFGTTYLDKLRFG